MAMMHIDRVVCCLDCLAAQGVVLKLSAQAAKVSPAKAGTQTCQAFWPPAAVGVTVSRQH